MAHAHLISLSYLQPDNIGFGHSFLRDIWHCWYCVSWPCPKTNHIRWCRDISAIIPRFWAISLLIAPTAQLFPSTFTGIKSICIMLWKTQALWFKTMNEQDTSISGEWWSTRTNNLVSLKNNLSPPIFTSKKSPSILRHTAYQILIL